MMTKRSGEGVIKKLTEKRENVIQSIVSNNTS